MVDTLRFPNIETKLVKLNVIAVMNAAELTRWAKAKLEAQGCRINRVNNIPVRRRKGTVQKGWADLQGYTKNGIYVACEIKTVNDRLSVEQIDRLNDVSLCGALAYLCRFIDGEPTLTIFGEE